MVEATKARIAAASSAMLYGRGVFTTVTVHGGQPFLWSRHWSRLVEHAEKLSIDVSTITEESVGEAVRKVIAVNQVEKGLARVILMARGGSEFWVSKSSNGFKTDLLIMTSNPQRVRSDGLTLAVSRYRFNTTSALAGVKSLNYLNHLLPWEEARNRDFDEAVMLNERGEIVSATMANIFWVKDGTLHTPTLSVGAVAGVTRGAVIELAEKQFIPVLEGVYEMGDLTEADEIFLTSASLGIGFVTTFDFRQYSVSSGTVAARLGEGFRKLLKGAI